MSISCCTPGRTPAGSAGCYWSNNRLVAQKTLYVYYPESSKVLASPCSVSLRITERWQVVLPECLTGKLSGYENEKSFGSVLWVSGAEGPYHHSRDVWQWLLIKGTSFRPAQVEGMRAGVTAGCAGVVSLQPAPRPPRPHRGVQQCLTTGNRAGVTALPMKELSSLFWRPQ